MCVHGGTVAEGLRSLPRKNKTKRKNKEKQTEQTNSHRSASTAVLRTIADAPRCRSSIVIDSCLACLQLDAARPAETSSDRLRSLPHADPRTSIR